MSYVVLFVATASSSAEPLFQIHPAEQSALPDCKQTVLPVLPYHKQTAQPVLSQLHTFYLTFPDPQKTAQPLFRLRCLFSFVFRADSVVFTILRNEVFLPPEAGLGSDLRCALIRGS